MTACVKTFFLYNDAGQCIYPNEEALSINFQIAENKLLIGTNNYLKNNIFDEKKLVFNCEK